MAKKKMHVSWPWLLLMLQGTCTWPKGAMYNVLERNSHVTSMTTTISTLVEVWPNFSNIPYYYSTEKLLVPCLSIPQPECMWLQCIYHWSTDSRILAVNFQVVSTLIGFSVSYESIQRELKAWLPCQRKEKVCVWEERLYWCLIMTSVRFQRYM